MCTCVCVCVTIDTIGHAHYTFSSLKVVSLLGCQQGAVRDNAKPVQVATVIAYVDSLETVAMTFLIKDALKVTNSIMPP